MFTLESERPMKDNVKTHDNTCIYKMTGRKKVNWWQGIKPSLGYKTKRKKLEKDIKK